MGGGSYNVDTSRAARTYRASSGTSAFAYHDKVRSGSAPAVAHADLSPKGVTFRESRDSDDHPTSVGVAVLFDVTGSMGSVPKTLVDKLPELFGLLLRKGYVEHPQVLIGAIGDATCDRVPLQIGQFESDNRVDENIGKIFLEGGGGGQTTESYELGMYFMCRHTAIDCFEKRGHKPYLFMIGDETAYPKVKASEVNKYIAAETELSEDIPLAVIVEELKSKFEVYFIIPSGSSYYNDSSISSFWKALFGQNVIMLDDLGAVAETIALTIGLSEGTTDLDTGLDDLLDVGLTTGGTVGKALAELSTVKGGLMATSSLPSDVTDDPTDRL